METETAIIAPNSITFGKYKGLTLSCMLRDRQYCKWFVSQNELCDRYPYITNQINLFLASNPFNIVKSNFEPGVSTEVFISKYSLFNLPKTTDLKIELTDTDKVCYKFYKKILKDLRKQIENRLIEPFNVKTPKSWLQSFEKETELSRDNLKEFLCMYDLPNITSVIEEIKVAPPVNCPIICAIKKATISKLVIITSASLL